MRQTEAGSRWLLRKARKGQVWCALLALSFGLSVVDVISNRWNPRADESAFAEGRALDSSLGSDPAATESNAPMGLIAFGFFASVFLGYLGLSLFSSWVSRRLDAELVERESSGLLVLSQTALALYLLRLYDPEAIPASLRTGLHLLSLLLIGMLIAKALASRRLRAGRAWAVGWGILNDDQLVLAVLFLPPALLALVGTLFGSVNPLAGQPVLVVFLAYVAVVLILAGAYWTLARHTVGRGGPGTALALYDLNTALIVGGAPLLLSPLSSLVANEIQFALPGVRPVVLAKGLVTILLAISVALFLLQRAGRLRLRGSSVLEGFYFPVAVATLVSFKTHQHFLRLGVLDYFESGLLGVPAQQLSDFGRVPLLDLIPDRGLSDAGIQSLFTLFHGSHDLEMLVWLPWLPVLVGFLSIYFFLSRLVPPLMALMITVLLPIRASVVGAYAIALLPAVILLAALRKPTFKRFLALWLVLEALWLWRPGLGLASLISAVVVVGVVMLVEKRDELAAVAGSLAAALLTVPVALLVAEVFANGDTSIALRSILSRGFDFGRGGFGSIVAGSGSVGLMLFAQRFLPLAAALCILAFLFQLAVRGVRSSSRGQAVFYLAVFSLVIPAKVEASATIARLDPSMGLFVLALAPLIGLQGRLRPRMVGRSSWILVTLVLSAILGPTADYPLVGSNEDFRFHQWGEGDRRVRFDKEPHRDLVEFLRQGVAGEATFFDFTDSPALYALTSERFPLFEMNVLGDTSELRQRQQLATLESTLEDGRLPFVVFGSPADRSKGTTLPREVTAYRIAEFVYRNYLPYADLGGWEVWRQRGLRLGRPNEPAKLLYPGRLSQQYALGVMPLRWAEEDQWRSVERNELLVTVLDAPTAVRPGLPLFLSWEQQIDPTGGSYLHLRARSMSRQASDVAVTDPTTLTVAYGGPLESTFQFTLKPSVYTPDGDETRVTLPLRNDPKTHLMRPGSGSPERLVFKTTGKDPWIRRFVDFSEAPAIDAAEEHWLRLSYRSSTPGRGQIFFAAGPRQFSERKSVRALMRVSLEGAAPGEITVPVVGVESGQALTDLRLDPPTDSEFEILGIELVRRPRRFDDFMIRMSTQWRWFDGNVQALTLRASAPVLVESVHLRAGD